MRTLRRILRSVILGALAQSSTCASLTYATNPATYPVGAAITTNSPTVVGGTPTSCGVCPALPAGPSLDPKTGAITGTPTAVAALATCPVTATNVVDHTSASLVITTASPALVNLAYSTPKPTSSTMGVAITADIPSCTGFAPASYGVSPALPSGLPLNTSTGVITGTPTPATATASFTGGQQRPGGVLNRA